MPIIMYEGKILEPSMSLEAKLSRCILGVSDSPELPTSIDDVSDHLYIQYRVHFVYISKPALNAFCEHGLRMDVDVSC